MKSASGDCTAATRPDRPATESVSRSEPRPFPWERLPRVGRREVALVRSLGGPSDGAALLDEIATELSRDLAVPVAFAVESITWEEPAQPASSPGCFALIELPPQPGEVVLDLDLGLALSAADRLLGGVGSAPSIARPPSAVERGVLSYLVLKALRRADLSWLAAAGLRPRLTRIAGEIQGRAEPGVAIRLAARLGDAAGTVVLRLPESVARSPVAVARRPRPLPGPLSHVELSLGVEVARDAFPREALARLAAGDVLLFGPTECDAEGSPTRARLRAGRSRTAGRARVRPVAGGAELILEGLVVEGEPMSDEARPAAGEQLLAEAEIPVTVELGRLTLTAEEIAGLRPGDTLLLARAPGDPLDLCAGGKRIARGELVDVDGELGLRLVQIV